MTSQYVWWGCMQEEAVTGMLMDVLTTTIS